LLSLGLTWMVCPQVSATEQQQDFRTIDQLIEFVGLNAQIDHVGDTIAFETRRALEACESTSQNAHQVAQSVKTLFAPDSLRAMVRSRLLAKLSDDQLAELSSWADTPLGEKIYAAESAVESQQPAELTKKERELTQSASWTQERQRQIYKIMRATRTHHYVAALNHALSSAVEMASACVPDYGTLNGIELKQIRDSSDEKLIAGMMLNNFIVPTGVIFEPLSNEELQEYFLFSATPTARLWYASVIDTVRAMIAEQIPKIRTIVELPNDKISTLSDTQ